MSLSHVVKLVKLGCTFIQGHSYTALLFCGSGLLYIV